MGLSNGAYNYSTGKYTGGTTCRYYKVGLYLRFFDNKTFGWKAPFMKKGWSGMEGQRFFTLRRFDGAPGYLQTYYDHFECYIAVEKTRPSFYIANPAVTFAPKYMWFPIPQTQIDVKNATGTVFLKQNLVFKLNPDFKLIFNKLKR
jgi:hypothetical protein